MYPIHEIAGLLDAEAVKDALVVSQFQVDSRKVTQPELTLFFCLKGARSNGHQYIPELIEAGVRCFVVSRDYPVKKEKGVIFISVPDVLSALRSVAAHHRQKMKVPVLAITGSNGKTIVKEWLFTLLQKQFQVYRSPGSYNSMIGVPLSLLGIEKNHDLAIIEVGISRAGEMEQQRQLVQPDFGLFTVLGSAHDEGFADNTHKLQEKTSLFKNAQWWIGAEKIAHFYSKNHTSLKTALHDSGFKWEDKKLLFNGTNIDFPFTDPASISNVSGILAFITKWAPAVLENVARQLPSLTAVSMRSQVRKGIRENIIISDHYNADLEGLVNVLDVAKTTDPNRGHLLIISDLYGIKWNKEVARSTGQAIGKSHVNEIWWVGQQGRNIQEYLSTNQTLKTFSSTQELVSYDKLKSIRNKGIILKGARSFQFESIEALLLQPVHGTYLQIDMEALLHNWNTLRNTLLPGVKSLVMIKAAAYGTGLKEMGIFYQEHQADYIGVAYPNEGVALREYGVTLPILVMNSDSSRWPLLVQYNLEPVIHSLGLLKSFLAVLPEGQALSFHLKINTGMNRLGFDREDLSEALDLLRSHPGLRCKSVMSHLNASENPNADDYTSRQFELFNDLYKMISTQLEIQPMRHILNSQGALRFKDMQMEMVRWGLVLYGLGQMPAGVHLHPVHSYKTHVIQLRRVPKGAYIGYGTQTKTNQERIIATLPVGYADGIFRSLSNGKLTVIIRGQEARSIGKICMDMTMVDVSHIDGISEGDEVEIFGENIRLEDLAVHAGTLPYEVLVQISQRVERVFLNG